MYLQLFGYLALMSGGSINRVSQFIYKCHLKNLNRIFYEYEDLAIYQCDGDNIFRQVLL